MKLTVMLNDALLYRYVTKCLFCYIVIFGIFFNLLIDNPIIHHYISKLHFRIAY